MPLSVDAQFTQLMDDMADFSDKIQKYLRGTSVQRLWMIPTGYSGGWSFDPTDIVNMGDPFERAQASQPNDLYADEYNNTGSGEIRAVMGTNVEIGYMGAMERAFRERHRTPTRAAMLLAGRRMGHADTTNGVHKAGVEGFVQELFNA
jgi:hypothetical protein